MTPTAITFIAILATAILSTIVGTIGYFITKALNKADAAFTEMIKLCEKVNALEKNLANQEIAFMNKLNETLVTLNKSIENLTIAVKPIEIVAYKVEQSELKLEKLADRVEKLVASE